MESASPTCEAVFDWLGFEPSEDQTRQLGEYAKWLVEEAIPAGGVGPREADRIWSRHIGDSLVFAAAWKDDLSPNELIDIGSGSGLPGIPLAILFPECQVTLLDRGGRRIRLLQRAVRVLDLDNATVVDRDAQTLDEKWRAITFRGSLRLASAAKLVRKCLLPDGVAVFGYSTKPDPDPVPDIDGINTKLNLVPPSVLGHSAWLLNMRLDD